jgi:dienelactone hydrolase
VPILANYGEKDENVNKDINEAMAAMKKYNTVYDYKIFAGAGHALKNDANPKSYHAQAAKEARLRTF